MKYLDFSVEEFLADEQFQQWVLSPEKEDRLFWENFLRAHPEKQMVISQAREVLKSIASREIPQIEEKHIDNLWQRIEASKKQEQLSNINHTSQKSKQVRIFPLYLRVAAVFLGVLVCTILVYTILKPADFIEHRTAFGKTKTITLPDKSVVMLNSNSKIRYASQWNSWQTREVWVEGEAYFSVVHTKNHQKFQVKAPSNMVVEVLGTEFNIKQRNSGTQVILKDGRVKLLLHHTDQEKEVLMAPSEVVELNKTASGYTKKRIDPEQFLSWTQHKLVFKNTSIAEIKTLLEETYGLVVNIPDKDLLEQKISGSIPSDNVESLLFALSESFNYQIIQQKNQLLFLERNPK